MSKLLVLIALLVTWLCPAALWAGSTFDNTCNAAFTSATTTNCTLTVGSGAQRAISASLLMQSNGASSISCSGAGATGWAAVTGTDTTTTGTTRSLIWAAVNPTSGINQTVTCSWTGSVTGQIGVVSASGVNQTTPMINGNKAQGTTASAAVTITTTAGNAAHDAAVSLSGHALSAPTQTQVWLVSPEGQSRCAASGASCAFAWTVGTNSGRTWTISGAMFNGAATGAAQRRTLKEIGTRTGSRGMAQ